MHNEIDVTPVIYRAKDRLPINFQNGIYVKDILLDGPDGSKAIGHRIDEKIYEVHDL